HVHVLAVSASGLHLAILIYVLSGGGLLAVGVHVLIFLFFFSSRRRHTRSVSAFLLNRSSDLNSSINFSVTDTNSSRTSEAALWPSTYISPLSNSTPCIRKDRISSKSLMRLSICLWKPSIGD